MRALHSKKSQTGDYYVSSFLMTEKTTTVNAEDGSTKDVTVLAAIDSRQFADKVTYTNNNPYRPNAPDNATLTFTGNEVMRAEWQPVTDADGYRVTIYQQQNGNWVDTGFGYDLDKDTTAVDMALTVGGEETEETKNLTVNHTYKVGVSAYREPEDGAKYYSAETESSGVLLPEYTPLNLALSVNGTACATDENGVYHAYVGGSSNSLAVTCAEAESITVTRMDTDARLAPGEANTFAIPDFTGTQMLRVNGVKGKDVISAFLLVSRDTTAPVLTLSAPLSTRTGLREPIKLPARRMPEAKSFTEKQRKRLCRRRRQLCGARSAGWRFRDFQKEAPQINSA